jgi:CubicO group peptidase (beta-lactamase class C family)
LGDAPPPERRRRALARLSELAPPLRPEAPAAPTLYSDLGFILLGFLLEDLAQDALPRLFQKEIAGPLALSAAFYSPRLIPLPSGLASAPPKGAALPIAPTEDGFRIPGPLTEKGLPLRGAVPLGRCHDDNAAYLGGAAGHAGLFASAPALWGILRSWALGFRGEGGLISAETLRLFLAPPKSRGGTRALGFDFPFGVGDKSSFWVGHHGYAGATLWWNPPRDWALILLANRVHPTSREGRLPLLRQKIAALLFKETLA